MNFPKTPGQCRYVLALRSNKPIIVGSGPAGSGKTMLDSNIKGSIINVSSQMGHVGGPNRTTYCSSKFAIEGFTKSLAIELGPDGIRVNAICPTFIQTPMTEPFLKDEDFKKATIGMIPIGRLGEVTDLMGPFVFLASEASSLMTGSSILVDGGWTAR